MKYVLRALEELKRGVRSWRQVQRVLRSRWQFKRRFEVLSLGEMCFEGMAAVGKVVSGVGTRSNVF